jgi:hypothetical protein
MITFIESFLVAAAVDLGVLIGAMAVLVILAKS